jgi:hypothetical protein
MNPTQVATQPRLPEAGPSIEAARRALAEHGYVTFDGVVDRRRLAGLTETIRQEFEDVRASGRLFSGGGTVHGHLNCFPGAASRFVYEALADRGILDVVRALSGRPLAHPNVGCNFNLPGSRPQNEHVDGYASAPFFVVNVAAVDTDLSNGAMEVLAGTHRRTYRYWELMVQRPKRVRVLMKPGDVVIRPSTLWHRGMPNFTRQGRPMLAFSWEDGGSSEADPYGIHGGRITFLPNRHRTDWAGRLRERAFVAAPALGTAFLVVQSLLAKRREESA